MYRIISNGVVFKVQKRMFFMWFTLGLYKSVPEAEALIKLLLTQDLADGKGRFMVHGVYDLKTNGSDWDEHPTNVERLLRK